MTLANSDLIEDLAKERDEAREVLNAISAENELLRQAIDDADRHVRRAFMRLAKLPDTHDRRNIEASLSKALDILQAELDDA